MPSNNQISKSMRMNLWHSYIGDEIGKTKCLCCNRNDITQMNFECGHIVSRHHGGSTTIENMMPICHMCNMAMGHNDLLIFKNQLSGKMPHYDEETNVHIQNIILYFRRMNDVLKNKQHLDTMEYTNFHDFCKNIYNLNMINGKNVEMTCYKCNALSFNYAADNKFIFFENWKIFYTHLECLLTQTNFLTICLNSLPIDQVQNLKVLNNKKVYNKIYSFLSYKNNNCHTKDQSSNTDDILPVNNTIHCYNTELYKNMEIICKDINHNQYGKQYPVCCIIS